jgi:hypothetical protein
MCLRISGALWRTLFRNPFAEAEESGLTGPQVTVIATLVTRGPMMLTELSRTLGMSHSTASGIVTGWNQEVSFSETPTRPTNVGRESWSPIR